MSGSKSANELDHLARDVLESLREGCQVIGFDWKYLFVNDEAARHGRFAQDALIGRTMMQCYPGIERTPMFSMLERCMRERAHDSMENEFEFPDGSKGWFLLRFVPVPAGLCVLSLDISQRKHSEAALARSEEQLRHAQKLEAVGRLAGGVAHDFNNMLSVILSYTSLIGAELADDDPLRADLDEIRKAGERAAGLTRQLLAFSRRQPLQPRIIDLNRILLEMEKMISRLVGADIELVMVRSAGLGKVNADPGQIEHALVNLVVNARDAMPQGGKLTIEACNSDLDERHALAHFGVTPGAYVMLAVADTGVGMNEATQAQIFEPFFTTKERGQGTGLGLSTVFGIVKQSGGHIWFSSEPGQGTTFEIYLPRCDATGAA